jgi:hypothetical protein
MMDMMNVPGIYFKNSNQMIYLGRKIQKLQQFLEGMEPAKWFKRK